MLVESARSAFSGFEDHLVRPVEVVVSDLESFFANLKKWQVAQNLVSRETLEQFWFRHVRDSLQLLPLLSELGGRIVDIGSGGGFPALPLAIALRGGRHEFTLVESNRRKASFLRTMIRTFELQGVVLDQRAELLGAADVGQVDVLTSRATASLVNLLEWTAKMRHPDTVALVHKGREYREEVAFALNTWQFDVVEIPSLTASDSALLKLSRIMPRTLAATTSS
ncbi:MAG: 16S rRNA (guanine(527)-N(7))-methyltransferase RsmG [Hyphomicrobiaceae bacterium]|nr:16S rRNA (guanine(527)-N(7))-methyltransferase RsmG [Hyphomicrobiaceae bacterium]